MAVISEHQVFLPEEPGASLQARLRESITSAIWDGRFAPGDRLPATRALARHLSIARITVSLAYEDLATSGYIVSRARSGFFVAADAPSRTPAGAPQAAEPEGAVDWEARLAPVLPALGRQAKPADWGAYPYPFVFGKPDMRSFPLDAWRACAREATNRRFFQEVADDAGDRDDPMLIDQIVKRSVSGRGVSARPEEVLVTFGGQNALWLAAEVLFGRAGDAQAARAAGARGHGDGPGARSVTGRVAIEDPGYPELRFLLARLGVVVLPVPVDAEGLVVEALPAGIDAVFVTPSHQAPTGVTMSLERRHALLTRAATDDFVVVEDDYDFEMSHGRPHAPALRAFDTEGRVIYLGSFSKSLFPGLRLGYLAGPAPFVARARALRTMVARHPPGITQRATAHFLALGHYNAHARTLRARIAERRRILLDALAAEGLQPAPGDRFGGASIWLEAPGGVDTDALAEALRREGVLIEPGAPFYAGSDPPRDRMRLGFSAIPATRIPEGAARLAAALRRHACA